MTDAASDKSPDLDQARDAILEKLVELAAFDGWSSASLARAAEEADATKNTMNLAFPKGVLDALEYHSQTGDEAMLTRLEDYDLGKMKIREKITLCVRLRIEAVADDKQAIRRAAHTLALPMNAATGLHITYRTVDAIWRGIGDTSTDFNFYSKRAVLAGVYTTTMMHWFDDMSDNDGDTWAFLDRRIENVMEFEKLKAKVRKATAGLPSPWSFLGGLRYPGGEKTDAKN